ncbi:MAG: PDZ domain-containing protein [Pirellulaceae bacterium]
MSQLVSYCRFRIISLRGGWRIRRRRVSLLALLAALAWAGPLAAQPVRQASQGGAASPAPEQIGRWVRELDDNRFLVRRNATEQLIQAGHVAIGPIRDAMAGSSLEVSTRGIYVLKAMAVSRDVATQDAAVEALQQLANSPFTSAARQATEAIAALSEVRQQRAIKELEDLGAKIARNDQLMVFAPTVGLRVEIGSTWQGTVDDLQRFRWLTEVQEVVFIGERITDEWIRSIEHLRGVERVLIKHARITNEALRSISQLKGVTNIDLMYTPVNDGVIAYLKDMDTVREVRLYGTDVTREAVEQYQATVRNVQVDFKMGAFLGVMCQQPPFPCQVVEVIAESAAARGGIEIRDIIVRYGGQPVATFDDLRKLIGKNKVGDSVLIQVLRGGVPVIGILEQRGPLELGLEVEPVSFGCKVSKLSEGGAAARAGLRPGDMIVELNGEPVANMEQLAKVFTPIAADEQVAFGILRDSRLVSVRVTFGEWTEAVR